MNDADYLFAFQKLVMPIAYEFAPDFIIGTWKAIRSIEDFLKQDWW